MNYVYSTLTASTAYAVYAPSNSKELDVIERTIVINGGSNVADKALQTPKGVVTQVSDHDLEILLADYHFKEHMKHGFITIERVKADVEEVVVNMQEKDRSAPLTPENPDLKASFGSELTDGKKKGKK